MFFYRIHALLAILCIYVATTQGVTIVYNMRIAQITRRQTITGNPSLIVANAFQQWFKLRNGLKQYSNGLLTSYIHTGSSWYAKIDIAGGHVHNSFNCQELTRNQTDDILISTGYGMEPRKGTKVSFTGHVGIPTHKDTILDGIQFGTGHYALGPQIDGSQAYNPLRPHFFLWALRLIHFFPRTITTPQGNPWPQKYSFALGNIFDIYLAHQSNWNMHHRIEFGYDGTFGFGADINPAFENFSATAHFLRNNFYISYARKIRAFGKPSGLIFTFSSGYDPYPTCLGRHYSVNIFISWAINF